MSAIGLSGSSWGSPFAGEGDPGWGETPWGDPVQQIRRVETLGLEDANACQLSTELRIRQAGAGWKFLGQAIVADDDRDTNDG